MTSENVQTLNDTYGLPGVLYFDQDAHGLTRAQISLPACSATVYLHGAHLTHWQPVGTTPVIFLSERSEFAEGRPIRGGIPLCFPWFGPRSDGAEGPTHGFARLESWKVALAALLPGKQQALHLTLTLAPSAKSHSLGFANFRVACEFIFSETLTMRFSVVNLGLGPLRFEEALHTYFKVHDVRESVLHGLESATYLDKTDGLKSKTMPAVPVALSHWTDSVFTGHTKTVTIEDPGHHRAMVVSKTNSHTTVVWNPWDVASAKMGDFDPAAWPGFVCVESANTGADAVTLAPNEAHTVELHVRVEGR